MKRFDHEQMLSLYQEWQTSGINKRDFAISQGVRPTTFYYWTRKFERAELSPAGGFQRISMEESYKSPGELMAAIQYPSGTRMEIYSSFQHVSASYVQLLKTLIQ